MRLLARVVIALETIDGKTFLGTGKDFLCLPLVTMCDTWASDLVVPTI